MKKSFVLYVSLLVLVLLSACSSSMNSTEVNPQLQSTPQKDVHHPRKKMMHHGQQSLSLQSSTGENELLVPPLLEKDRVEGNDIYYTIEAQKGKTAIFESIKTETYGYNGSFLGPVVQLKEGQRAHITLKNSLDEPTTFHWHGLIIPGDVDGGPHDSILPGEKKEITFDVQQERSTLWFHPHPLGETAKQVYKGLAGLLYIQDEQQDPYEYGENDYPLIIQDKQFTADKQLSFETAYHPDGTTGDTVLINGTVNPRLTVNREKVRLRLVNGSNRRNFTFTLSNGQSFTQTASDGGLLNKPVELTELKLTPSERAEIVVDFSKLNKNEKIELITKEGLVLLPFKLTDQQGTIDKNELERNNPITLSDDILQKEVSKKIELFGRMHHVLIDGEKFDMERIDLTQKQAETEIWEIYNRPDRMGGMIHPFHIHDTQFQVISIDGEKPSKNMQGYKDTISIDPGERIKLAVSFPEKGVYMYHCHILEHEDHGMMGQIKVE